MPPTKRSNKTRNLDDEPATKKPRKAVSSKRQVRVGVASNGEEEEEEESDHDLSLYPTRTDLPWKFGPHVSAAGGVENAVVNAASIGYVSRCQEFLRLYIYGVWTC